MKVWFRTFILVTLLAFGCSAFQVTSPKLVFGPDETGFGISAPSGGLFGDFIISTCRRVFQSGGAHSTLLYKKKADGAYEMFLFPELQVCPSSSSFDRTYTAANGKWIFITVYNSTTVPRSSSSSFFTLTNESDLVLATRYEEPLSMLDHSYCVYARFISEDTLATIVYRGTSSVYQFVEWTYDGSGWNITSEQNVKSVDLNNITAPNSIYLEPSTYIGLSDGSPTLFSKPQENYQWTLSALFGQNYYEPYESYAYANGHAVPAYYNGNDTAIYAGATPLDWSSGTIYIAQYQKSNNTWRIAQKFNSEDIQLDNEYLNIAYSWVNSVVWINQDMAFLMAPNFPLNYNETDWMYGGSVVMMYRDNSNQWQMGGRITINGDDGSGEAVQLTYLTRTKNDIMIVGNVIDTLNTPTKYFLYTYPLCFPNKMNFTCHQNISIDACNEADFTLPNDIRTVTNYTDDKCGDPFTTVRHVEIVDRTATVDLKFERLGLEVGQCTATFFCPPPPPLPPVSQSPSPPKISGATLVRFTSDMTRVCLTSMVIAGLAL